MKNMTTYCAGCTSLPCSTFDVVDCLCHSFKGCALPPCSLECFLPFSIGLSDMPQGQHSILLTIIVSLYNECWLIH